MKLSTCQKDLTTALTLSSSSSASALKNFEDLLEGNTLPAPQEYANKLSALEPVMAKAVSGLERTIRSRKQLLAQLQSLVNSNQSLIKEEENKLDDLKSKSARVVETKTEINEMLADESMAAPVEESTSAPSAPQAFNSTSLPTQPAEQEEYQPQQFLTDMEAPAYSPISSDSDSDDEKTNTDTQTGEKRSAEEPEQLAKKAKTEPVTPGLEGLDPQVAKFLSSLVGNS